MTTAWHELQHEPITWEMFLDIDEELRRDLEIVDGYGVPREQRSREHQKVATRLSLTLETAAVQQMRKAGSAECHETNTEVDVLLWEVPPTARKPDAVLHPVHPGWRATRRGACCDRGGGAIHLVGPPGPRAQDVGLCRRGHPALLACRVRQGRRGDHRAVRPRGGSGELCPRRDLASRHGAGGGEGLRPVPIEIFWADLEVAPRV